MKSFLKSLKLPIFFIVVCTIARILPHPANFTPIGAIALFGGVYLSKRQALFAPIISMLISDFVIGFDSLPMRISIYGSILVEVLLGFWLKKNKNTYSIITSSLLSSLVFFFITNFSVWYFGSMYSKSISGLMDCYILAIPFFKNTLIGDLFYTGIFFGGYEFIKGFIVPNCKLKIVN